jgi:hypothetical protein
MVVDTAIVLLRFWSVRLQKSPTSFSLDDVVIPIAWLFNIGLCIVGIRRFAQIHRSYSTLMPDQWWFVMAQLVVIKSGSCKLIPLCWCAGSNMSSLPNGSAIRDCLSQDIRTTTLPPHLYRPTFEDNFPRLDIHTFGILHRIHRCNRRAVRPT